MSVKFRIIALSLVGNAAIALIFFALSEYQGEQRESASIESSASVYGQAWRTVLNDSFSSSIGTFHPQSGEIEKARIWNESLVEVGGEEIDLIALVNDGNSEAIETALDSYFAEAFEWGDLSFVMVFGRDGESLGCSTAYDGYGIDACDDSADPDFVSASTRRLLAGPANELSLGSVRGVSTILDVSNESMPGFFHTLQIELSAGQKKIGTVVLGKSLIEALEIFEYEFLVKGLINTDKQTVSLDDYFLGDDYAELGDTTDVIAPIPSLITSNRSSLLDLGYWGELVRDQGVAYVAIGLSDYSKINDARLIVISNQRESVAKSQEADFYALATFLTVYLLILLLVILLTTYSFGGINKAIEVLTALTEGNLDIKMPGRRFFSSDRDEVGALTKSLETYRGHLKEIERIRSEQSQKRKERDSVIISKMSSLSNLLVGEAKKVIDDDIERMKAVVETEDFEKAEEASTEMMGIAISRMSDEVVSLIEARTGEIQAALARNEELLLNILPESIAARKLANEKVIADSHESCSVLFGDIVGFTEISARLGPEKLVGFLDEIFSKFDEFSDELGLEKIKTIGDNYMVACGVPNPDPDHAYKIAEMGRRMVDYVRTYSLEEDARTAMRIGIHSGPLVAGVIGKRKFIYDLWGDAVNTAARMESHGLPNRVHMTAETAKSISDRFKTERRGIIEIKGKGPIETYLLSA